MRAVLLYLVIVIFFKVMPADSAEVVDKVVAIVNDEIITQSDVEKILAPLSAQYVTVYSKEEFPRKLAEAKRNIINKLIEDKLILAEAKNQKIEVSDEEVEAEIEKLKAQFSSPDEFETALFKQGLEIADLEKNYHNQIMIQKVINSQVKSKVVIKPTEITDYYYAHLDDFTKPQEVKVSHILIRIENGADAKDAYQRAQKVLDILDKGADFSQVARTYSDGPRANEGGNIGFVSRGQMIKEIDEVIFKLKVGELSGLIKTDLGYHIVKVEDIRPSALLDLTEVQSKIRDILFHKKIEKNFTEWLNKLKKNAFISIKEN
jgi:parvulin-like peptidyl-prolyl isomerase